MIAKIRFATGILACAPLLSMAAGVSADIGTVPQGRLPPLARPVGYHVDLTVLPEQARFSGHVEIEVELPAPTRALWINGRGLHVWRVQARAGARRVSGRYAQVDPLGVSRLDFAVALPAGRASLVFDYDAPFSSAASALFHVKVGPDWYAWSQFESTDARGAFPGFDEPGYKTPFSVTLTTHPGQVTTSNAPETGKQASNSLERHVFAPTEPLPTYLVQFGAGPFVVATGQVPPTPQRAAPLPLRIVATRPNADKLAYALAETPRIVQLLEQYFGQPFPFPKLDQIASPVMGGAMENAGADTYRDDLLLLTPDAPTVQRQTFGMVVAHELAHQWFGDLVTPDWWSDIWLNESFANWMGYRIGNEWRPELNIGVGAIDDGLTAMTLDSLVAGRPIHQAITRTGEIESAFDSVTYGKGGQVIAMIAAYLGDERFRDGVRLHLSRHRYGNATSEDFFTALSDAAQDPRVLKALKSFVDQQGVPVVRISHHGSQVVATQSRSALLGSTPPPVTWTIPLCLRMGEQRACSLLDSASMPLDIDPQLPLMPNAGGVGYYRFALDDADWHRLIAASPALPAGEALALTDSLWASFRAGDLPPARLLEAARAMAGNPDSSAASDGGERLAGLRLRGMIAGTTLADYRRTMQAIYGPRLAALGADVEAGAYAQDPPDRTKQRASLINLLATEARDEALRERLLAAARRYLAGDQAALGESYRALALSVYVDHEGVPASKEVLSRLVDSSDQKLRRDALAALAGAESPAQVQWTFDALDHSALEHAEKFDLVNIMMSEPASRDVAYGYLVSHFEELAKDAGIFSFGRLMDMPLYCSVERADELARTLGARSREHQRGSLELARAVERVRSCGLLQARRGTELAAALADPGGGSRAGR